MCCGDHLPSDGKINYYNCIIFPGSKDNNKSLYLLPFIIQDVFFVPEVEAGKFGKIRKAVKKVVKVAKAANTIANCAANPALCTIPG